MQEKGTTRNTGSPSGDSGVDQLAARERKAGPFGMAEGLVVPMKTGNSDRGKCFQKLQTVSHAMALAIDVLGRELHIIGTEILMRTLAAWRPGRAQLSAARSLLVSKM